MNYSKDVLSRARAILAQRKADRESENAAKLQSAYARVPRLKEIDMALVSTMAQAAQAAFLQGSDGKAALERARQSNLQLQEERNALVERYWEPGYLNEEPVCPHCGGTGFLGAQMCQCLKALCAQEQRKEMGAAFQNAGFDSFLLDYYSDTVIPQLKLSPRSVMEKTLGSCRRYARNFSMDAGNLLLSGGTGLGKTHLALAIGAAVGEQGYSVCYETAAGLFSKLEKAKFTPSEENSREAEKLENCDLLILDDLGTEMPGQFVTAALYNLLNNRLLAKRPMIITTNLNVDEAAGRYSGQIASRLYGEFKRLTFLGSDIRIIKSRG
jgi:DNA replication protein DnaC